MKKHFIYQTNNFGNSTVWIRRCINSFLGIALIFFVDIERLMEGSQFPSYGYVLLGVAALVITLIWPVDELAVDTEQIYFESKSLFPALNKVTNYKISELKGIGTSSRSYDILSLILPVWSKNKVEIIFKNGSVYSCDLITHKKELQEILLKVRGMMAESNDIASMK